MKSQEVIAATRRWLERAVIGLNLCPFAASVYHADRVRFTVSRQRGIDGLLADLRTELLYLHETDPARLDNTLLVHPDVLGDFLQFNDFLGVCEALLVDLDLEGELQVASFHPLYQFADAAPDDIGNFTNRSPFPILHILREDSVERGVAAFGDTESISDNNIRKLRALGHEGWQALWRD